jgi:hypothetical protein
MADRKYAVTLRSHESEDGESSLLEAYVDQNGGLVLERVDISHSVERFRGDYDHEYWRRVKAEQVPRVLLELIKDRSSRRLGVSRVAAVEGHQ